MTDKRAGFSVAFRKSNLKPTIRALGVRLNEFANRGKIDQAIQVSKGLHLLECIKRKQGMDGKDGSQ